MIEQNELIERWANVERVLEAMPEHERQKHWDMSTWGAQTTCRTVACAAGHCGLDPWFRERGFKLDFDGVDGVISDVDDFFGNEGSWLIFRNSTRRPVERVINEVRAHLGDLRRMAALSSAAPCRIGEVWPGQGGIYAGARLGRDGAPDYHLIVGPEHESSISWDEAMSWAVGHRDFALPFPIEQRALFDRVRNLFQRDGYWSCEQHASDSGNAWFQYFDYGGQYGWSKHFKLRARLVRRISIQ